MIVRNQKADEEDRGDVELINKLVVGRGWCINLGLTSPIRQNTFLIALGISLFGSSCSAAVKPTTSLPEYANAAIMITLQNPYHPLCVAPG
jgi:hypothetical protein